MYIAFVCVSDFQYMDVLSYNRPEFAKKVCHLPEPVKKLVMGRYEKCTDGEDTNAKPFQFRNSAF